MPLGAGEAEKEVIEGREAESATETDRRGAVLRSSHGRGGRTVGQETENGLPQWSVYTYHNGQSPMPQWLLCNTTSALSERSPKFSAVSMSVCLYKRLCV